MIPDAATTPYEAWAKDARLREPATVTVGDGWRMTWSHRLPAAGYRLSVGRVQEAQQ